MSHFAHVVNKKVVSVIVAEQEFINTLPNPEEFIQTSYNTFGGVHYEPNTFPRVASADQSKSLRKNYAGIGFTYDSDKDAFIAPKPYPSWTLNENTCQWEPPVPLPNDDKFYRWDETTTSWVEVT